MKRLVRPFLIMTMIIFGEIRAEEDLEITKVDVAKLATHAYGTEFLLLENSYREQKSYRFEDFFWTGSGDGPPEENPWTSEPPAIIYKTSTVISTVFVETPNTYFNETTTEKSKCTFNCESPITSNGEITPTPTIPTENRDGDNDVGDDFFDADRQFWLLTVLKSDGKDPIIIDLKNSLAKLYKTAFQRQQENHLGITHRAKRTPKDKPVNVYIHKMDKQKLNGDSKIEVLYHVELLGKPVDAYTAANDMKLVTDMEVQEELGYPFFIKAEPYLKPMEPLGLATAKNTWFFIGISLIGLLVLLLVIAFLILGFTKRKRSPSPTSIGVENRRHIFERGVGHENKGLVNDEEGEGTRRPSPTYINFGDKDGRGSLVLRPPSSASGSSSSSSSLDISPLMNLTKKHKTPPKKPPRPKAALNKTVPLNTIVRNLPPEVFDSDSSSCGRKEGSPDMGYPGNFDPGVISPKSYLSMPSVKSFPRGNMPEPLNKVLEPVSVTHLDMPEDDAGQPSQSYIKYPSDTLIRHGSVGTVEDPGVIGPVVWNMHLDRLKHGVSVDQGINDLKSATNISRMRKRFHDLLDDTFSLFGNSRKGSPVNTPVDDRSRPIAIEVKSHSANDSRPLEDPIILLKPRPKTTGTKKPDPSSYPSFAWGSTAPSPLVRPLSAGVIAPKAPRVNVDHVLAEGKFRPSDPAISVIEAIKGEIKRVSLPGSTTDLAK